MLNIFKKKFDPNIRAIAVVEPIVDLVFESEQKFQEMSIAELRQRVDEMRESIKPLADLITPEQRSSLTRTTNKQLSPDERAIIDKLTGYIPEFFAIMREINRRKFGKPHYRVQLIAATILAHGNKLTELKTGEGKTQVFHLPAALYGLSGRGSHVITVNDYLAKRDGEHAGHAMSDLGITVGIITPQSAYKFVSDEDLATIKGPEAAEMRKNIDISKLSDMRGVNLIECEKSEAYGCDVIYGTNNEFGFDYLRDNMVFNLEKRVQRELYFCIIDEADSILIDEARTPLIISAPAEASNELYQQFASLITRLDPEKHYTVDEKSHSAALTEEGVMYAEKVLNVSNIWEDYRLAHHLDNALKAATLFKLDEEYIIRDGEVLIVDDFTGRVLAGRRYSDGLHQAIEAKENVEIKRESKTMATITFQNFFRLYKILSGGSGTIMTEAEEFLKIYNLESYEIPSNKPVIREDKTDKVYKNRKAKFDAVVEEIDIIHETGKPVLVGTTSVEASEYLSNQLDKRGIKHEVLNAKFHEREATIVSKAGNLGAVTVATNMAGRGTDIPLGKGVIDLGGLHIIGTERHDARRVDNQLRGRAGRQGEPGTSQFFVALDDEIMRIQGGEIVQRLMNMANIPDDMPIESGMIGKNIENAQKKMEGQHFDVRKKLVEYDDIMNQQREIFYTRRFNTIYQTAQAESTDEKLKQEYQQTIENTLQEMLLTESDQIINNHLSNSDSKLDTNALMRDFADLAPDDAIVDAFKSDPAFAALSEKSQNLFAQEIISSLASKSPEQIKEVLENTVNKMWSTKVDEFGENLPEIYKISMIQVMDELWTEHLNAMGDLREGIGLRGYAQRDPLVEYKNESFILFESFIDKINSQVARRILKIRKVKRTEVKTPLITNEAEVTDVLTGSREMKAKANNKVAKPNTVLKNSKVGRNDLCPCGSGKKFKKCGMIGAPEHKA